MRITIHREKELQEARKIQEEARRLHLSPPVLALWEAELLDKDGKIIEKIKSKCNSYVRNGLNLIASNGTYTTTEVIVADFSDGNISYKETTGDIYSSVLGFGVIPSTSSVILGTGTDAESLDSFNLTRINVDWTISATSRGSLFDNVNRKFITVISRGFKNETGSSVDITESGVTVSIRTVGSFNVTSTVLVVRDLLAVPIAVADEQSLSFRYKFETLF